MSGVTPAPERGLQAPLGSGMALPAGFLWINRRFTLILVVICVLGLGSRVAILVGYVRSCALAGTPINDAETFWRWAGEIASGNWELDAPFFSAPLYAYVLGVLRRFGMGLTGIYLLQSLATVGTAGLLGWTARRRFDPLTGILAAAIFLLLRESASSALRVLDSTLQLLICTMTWTTLLAWQSGRSTRQAGIAGVTLGLLCLSYAPALALVLPVVAWMYWEGRAGRGGVAGSSVALLTSLLTIAPATIHNYRASGELFLIRGGAGVTLAQGNQPGAEGVYTPVPGIDTRRDRMHRDVMRIYQEATGGEKSWAAADRFFREQATAFWRSDPARAAGLAMRKLWLFLTSQNYSDIYSPNAEIADGMNRWLRLAPVEASWLMGPALVGLVLMARRPIRFAPELLMFLVPLLIVVVFWYSPRYRVPAIPTLVLASAWTLARLRQWREHRVESGIVLGALAASLSTGAINRARGLDVLDLSSPRFSMAYALRAQGRTPEAIEQLRLGLAFDNRSAEKRAALGELLVEIGEYDAGLSELMRATLAAPQDVSLRLQYGKGLIRAKRFDHAEAILQTARKEAPENPDTLLSLAELYRATDQKEAFAEYAALALAKRPDNAQVRQKYADVLTKLGRWDAAKVQIDELLRRTPDDVAACRMLAMVEAQRGDLAAAHAAGERAARLLPGDVGILHDLAVIEARQGNLDGAAARLRHALEINPKDSQCAATLKQIEQAMARRRAQPPSR